MKKTLLALFTMAGCAGTFGSGYTAHSTAGRVLALAEGGVLLETEASILCDHGQTQWMRDSGRWDRHASNGNLLVEVDPLLGSQRPSGTVIDVAPAAAAAAIAIGYAVLPRAHVPRWVRDGFLVLIAAGETANVLGNQRQFVGAPACGM